jgi:uncharacterized protein with NAD-binding domain and iron-sulfur cluster
MDTPRKQQIAILGGGAASMATAWGLTSAPGWQDRYDITVYQMGWRLGGKGASGRNADMANRIEEHGVHIWLGFYENAFRVIRQVYQECADAGLIAGSPLSDWTKAFSRHSVMSAMDNASGTWKPWGVSWPMNDELPGEEALFEQKAQAPTPWDYVVKLTGWMTARAEGLGPHPSPSSSPGPMELPDWVDHLLRDVAGIGEPSAAAQAAAKPQDWGYLAVAHELATQMHPDPSAHTADQHKGLVSLLESAAHHLFARLGYPDLGEDIRQTIIAIDIAAAIARGLVMDDILHKGFDVIDDVELIEWLVKHGCRHPDAPVIRSGYDACFAYVDGDPARPRFSAGVAVHGGLRMWLTYRGAIMWRMCAGMGDTIFAPLYLALKRRGVKFAFFHRVDNVGLSADGTAVDRIDMTVQATPSNPARGYEPIVTVGGVPCWPDRPLFTQLAEGELLKGHNLESAWDTWPGTPKVLRRGVDFDLVVFGISLGSVPWVCKELVRARPAWQDMVANIKTVQTQGLQLWMNQSSADLGYDAGLVTSELPVMTSYLEPFDTYVDMSHLIPREEWPEGAIKQIAYFCNCLTEMTPAPAPFTDPSFPARQLAKVREQTDEFLKTVGVWWPKGGESAPGMFNYALLVDPQNRSGAARMDAQFFRANIDPSERYVLSVPGSTKHRLPPSQSGFANLYLAGDWTRTPMNSGCVEAAVQSGCEAAQAICGYPEHIYGAFSLPVRDEDKT